MKYPKTMDAVSLSGFPADMKILETRDGLWGMRVSDSLLWQHLLGVLPGVYASGTPMGQVFHGKWKPDTAVALLEGFDTNAWPQLTLTDAEVMAYLRREALPNPERKEGLHRVIWNGVSIGFVNANRHQWNNLWPMEWRLRMAATGPARVLQQGL